MPADHGTIGNGARGGRTAKGRVWLALLAVALAGGGTHGLVVGRGGDSDRTCFDCLRADPRRRTPTSAARDLREPVCACRAALSPARCDDHTQGLPQLSELRGRHPQGRTGAGLHEPLSPGHGSPGAAISAPRAQQPAADRHPGGAARGASPPSRGPRRQAPGLPFAQCLRRLALHARPAERAAQAALHGLLCGLTRRRLSARDPERGRRRRRCVHYTLLRQPPPLRSQLRVIYETPATLSHSLAAHPRPPRRPGAARAALSSAILALWQEPEGMEMLERVQLGAPVAADYRRDYAPLERLRLEKYVVIRRDAQPRRKSGGGP